MIIRSVDLIRGDWALVFAKVRRLRKGTKSINNTDIGDYGFPKNLETRSG